jgi:Na+/proline symporter
MIVGLGALALESTPAFPTFPRLMTAQEVASGLILPYTSQAVAGKGGAAAILLVIFMVGVSSLVSLDGTITDMYPRLQLLFRRPSSSQCALLRLSTSMGHTSTKSQRTSN